tara:strand:+ start:1314 stop:2207 length:894 start_codon:yes stop_codon:yes gene_type:complete
MNKSFNFLKNLARTILFSPERMLIHTKFLASPLTKRNFFKNSPNQDWYDSLISFRKNGFAKLPSLLTEEECTIYKDLKNSEILELAEGGNLPLLRFSKNLNKVNSESGILCQEIYPDSKLLNKESYWRSFEWLIESYLGSKNFWIRNGPMIMSDHKKIKTKKNAVNYYHIDLAMHQLGFIVLLKSTNEDSTCTQVIPRTHRSYRLNFEFYKHQRDKNSFINYSKLKEKKFNSVKLIGEIGSTFIFDAGNMLHRGLPGEDRILCQINFTSSRTLTEGTTNKNSGFIIDAIGKKPSQCF